MTWGVPTDVFVQIHVVISLVAIVAGLIVLYGLLTAAVSRGWTALFLVMSLLTSVTGFPLAPPGFDPAEAFGVILLVLVVVAIAAIYAYHLAGAWRWIYAVSAVAALYLNVFVAIVQAFQKLAFLQPVASVAPVVQVVVLLAFVVLAILAVRRFHPGAA